MIALSLLSGIACVTVKQLPMEGSLSAYRAIAIAATLVSGCVHAPMPTPYIEDSLKSLRDKTTAYYDNLISHVGDDGCKYSNGQAFWSEANQLLTVLTYRVRVRPEDRIMVDPLEELKNTYSLYEVAQKTAEANPAPSPPSGQNAQCLPATLAAQNSARLEDGIDHLMVLQATRKEVAK
jgi:hypothetical protein